MISSYLSKYPESFLTFMDQTKECPGHNWVNGKCQNCGRWMEWKEYKNCSDEEKFSANLRQILPNEILIDVESTEEGVKVLEKIKEEKLKFYAYATGSRGYHISLFFNNLAELDIRVRNKIRKEFIKRYGADEVKSSEEGLLAMEDKPHFKTGKNKVLIESDAGENTLSEEQITKVKESIIKEIEVLRQLKFASKESFKDYHLKDKLFLYFMSGVIPQNQRKNDILFKNFAVALVNEGLSVEEIKNLVEPVINEFYKDKKWMEFYGWVLKAIKGQVLEYNIFELNEWSRKYNHEVFYEEITEVNTIIDNLSISQLWDAYWDENIVAQPIWKKLCLNNLIGTVLDEKELDDLRIHIMFSCYTTSGKDEGLNLIEEILKELDLTCGTFSSITDRTLVGAVNNTLKAQNDKHGLLLPGDTITVRGQTHEYINPIEYGILKTYKWIGFPEAETIISPRQYNSNLQLLLRQVMDKKREINKGVSGCAINFKTNTTLAFTTFPMEKQVSLLLTNGLFQRMLFYHLDFTKEMHDKVLDKGINSVFVAGKINKNKIYKDALVKKLKELKDWWFANREEYLNDYNKRNGIFTAYINNKIKDIEKKYFYLSKENQKIIDAMLRRSTPNIVRKLIINNSLINNKEVTTKIIDEALSLFETCLQSAVSLVWENKGRKTYIEQEEKLDKNLLAIKSLIRTYGTCNDPNYEISLNYLNELMDSKLNLKSNKTRVRWLQRAEDENIVKRLRDVGKSSFTVIMPKEED